ncbi:hypothetical protein SNF32_03135 [Enterococcus mundtii]|nr:hypothetical protein [Enterococcus mundtii]
MITATKAAKKVPPRYNPKIGFTNVSFPILCFAIEAAVKKNTKSGAIAFKQLTNNVPNKAINPQVGKKYLLLYQLKYHNQYVELTTCPRISLTNNHPFIV